VLNTVLILAAAAAGGLLAVQVAANSSLGQHLGRPAGATLVSFIVGSVGLVLYMLLVREPWPSVKALQGSPWWALGGGLLGAGYVMATVVVTPRLGPGLTLGAVVAGQMIVALALEQAGVLEVTRQPITPVRVLGVVLIVAGVALLRRV
jgi:bacterial/archaeal transporter family-2 protein